LKTKIIGAERSVPLCGKGEGAILPEPPREQTRLRVSYTSVVRLALSVAAIGMGLVVACEALPAIVFYSDDGGTDASIAPPSPDAGAIGVQGTQDAAAGGDASAIVDASLDHGVPAVDAADGAPASDKCPAAPPPGASFCCGTTPVQRRPGRLRLVLHELRERLQRRANLLPRQERELRRMLGGRLPVAGETALRHQWSP
jgi:hypothetical protein